MRERRSVNSHEARSIIASARRELRISCSIVSSSTRLSLPARWPGSDRQLAEPRLRHGAGVERRRAAASSCRAARAAASPAASGSARAASGPPRARRPARRGAARPDRPPAPRAGMPLEQPLRRKTAAPAAANAVGLAGVGMGCGWCRGPARVAFDSTPPPRRSDRSDRAPWPRGLDQVLALDAQPHGDRRGDEDRRVDAEQDADGQRHREVVQRRAAEEQHRQHHHLRRAVGDDGAADRAGDRVVDDLVRWSSCGSAGRSRGSGRR